jgi:hypothetical protein
LSVLWFVLGLCIILLAAILRSFGVRPRPRRRAGYYVLRGGALLLASVPASAVLTWLLVPFWRWLEGRYGTESIGHSGPAEWRFLATFVTCAAVVCVAGVLVANRRP